MRLIKNSQLKDPMKKPKGNMNLHKHGKQFGPDYQVTPEQRAKAGETKKKKTAERRQLVDLLQLAFKGELGEEIKEQIEEDLGMLPTTIEEALHLIQVTKAIKKKDTFAYATLMQAAGINKTNIDHTSGGKPVTNDVDYTNYSDEDLITLKKIHEKYNAPRPD